MNSADQLVIDFKAARVRKDVAFTRIENAEQQLRLDWIAKATEALRGFYRGRTQSLPVEAARVVLASTLPKPGELRWWGVATQRAIERGYLVHQTGDFARTSSSNRSFRACYVGGPDA